jgi:MerR family redox-sensitive transcriptional activator SoxR
MAELLTIGDAARIAGVSVDTMRRWEREGKIVATRTAGNQRRFKRDDLNQIVRAA